MSRDYRDEINQNIRLTGGDFFIDPEIKQVGDKDVLHWNNTLLALTYELDYNGLIVGEPGFAKTTAMKVLSVFSGYPFDLYEAAQIQGHPDQTMETMLARLDFSKLREKESVIWLTSAYLPVRLIDEVNRLTGGNQDEVLNALETGRFNYLNATFYTGKTPFLATANHPDDGNHVLIPPIRDRFATHVEVGHIGSTYLEEIERAEDNIEELKDDELTTKIIDIINDPKKTVKQRLELIDKERQDYVKFIQSDEIGGFVHSKEDRKAVQKAIRAIELDDHARIFLQMIDSELNTTAQYGRKRSNDPIDKSNHAKNLASTNVQNAASPRAIIRGIKRYAQGLAYLLGDKITEKHHINAVAPHALGHRLEFTQDFKAAHETEKREGRYGMTREMHFAKKLVEGVEQNFSGADGKGGIKARADLLRVAFLKPETLTKKQKKEYEEMLDNAEILDHPLLREYATRLKERR